MTIDGRLKTPVNAGVHLFICVRGNYERYFFVQQQ